MLSFVRIVFLGGIEMQEARMLGNYVEHLANSKGLSVSDLSQILNFTENNVLAFLKGRTFASFSQLSNLADALETTIENLLGGDISQYNDTVVHCMNGFKDIEKREEILDLIDNYIDICNAVDSL